MCSHSSVVEGVEKLEPSDIAVGEECQMLQILWKMLWPYLKKLNKELPCDLAKLLLGIYSKLVKAGSQTDICAPMLIAI